MIHAPADRAKNTRNAAVPDLIAALLQAGRAVDAEAQCRMALKTKPGQPDLLFLLAQALAAQGQLLHAEKTLDKALSRAPKVVAGWMLAGTLADHLGNAERSTKAWGQVTRLAPSSGAWFNLGNAQRRLGKQAQAAQSYEKAHLADPQDATILSALIGRRQALCQWDGLDVLTRRLETLIDAGKPGIQPFRLLALDMGQGYHLKAAQTAASIFPKHPRPLITKKERPVIGYVSADFHTHATAWLMAEVFELHDRQAFETHAFSTGQNDNSAVRRRLEAAFDQFHSLQNATDQEIATEISRFNVDILVDLKGYTRDGRLGVFGLRPAPVQVSWIGYPGTTGVDFIDYVIGDRWVLPMEDQPFYTEKIIQLPNSYQCNDRKRPIPQALSRNAYGLPADGMVLACFNAPYKYGPAVFDVWMRLLAARPNTHLWLMGGEDEAEKALLARAKGFGLKGRITFARHVPLEEHLARHGTVDLVLDTLPYNAHTTGSDALWMGCPVLTCPGDSFAARVGASLVSAAELPDLIVKDLAAYEATALELIDTPQRLQDYRTHLETNRLKLPLFDTPTLVRDLEEAYRTMLCTVSS